MLVGTETFDDAGVYRIDDSKALVQSIDFFPPVVDDPFTFGAIAAANALSDIYAMGAKPVFALNIVAFPSSKIPLEVLKEILKGGADKAKEAGIPVIGGHTIDDKEPKYGMCVTGIVHPDRIIRNKGAVPGDCIILTKPLGTGIATTAMKHGECPLAVEETAVRTMLELNRKACELMLVFPVHAATDVTGYGLLGHLYEMISASGVSCELDFGSLPVIEGVKDLIEDEYVPGGTFRNLEYFGRFSDLSALEEWQKIAVADAQTSGGLLIALGAEHCDGLTDLMRRNGLDPRVIGKIVPEGKAGIRFL